MRVAFVTCSDLSRYFVSKKNPLVTHDDQVACDYLEQRGVHVEPLVWGTKVTTPFDLIIIRSPWDYMDSDENRAGFFEWLGELHKAGAKIANPYSTLTWSLDKHYLRELDERGIRIVPSDFIEATDSPELLLHYFKQHSQMVVKPAISAAAKDTYRILDRAELESFLVLFKDLRRNRSFIVQPYIKEICQTGEWSLVFLNGSYSHAVHKLPGVGHWLVQDELGGSVQSLDPPARVIDFAISAYAKLSLDLLYARVDIIGSDELMLSELELVEPELFFLDRKTNAPNCAALEKFFQGVMRLIDDGTENNLVEGPIE